MGNTLGHKSAKGMKMLVAKGALEGLKSVDMGLCESCVMGKQKRVSFTKIPREPKKVRLEMVHTDVWVPSPVSSLGGSRFYVTFIDDFSRKVEFVSLCILYSHIYCGLLIFFVDVGRLTEPR